RSSLKPLKSYRMRSTPSDGHRLLMSSGSNSAAAGRLQQAQALASGLFCFAVALPLILNFQALHFIGIHDLAVGSLELAIGHRLRHQQSSIRSANPEIGMSA